MTRILSVTFMLMALFTGLQGQTSGGLEDEDRANLQPWADYNPSYILSTRSSVYGSLGARTIFSPKWHRIYARGAYQYDITTFNERTERYRTWQLHGGVTAFYTRNLEATDILEIRPFQGLKVNLPNWDHFKLTQYLRLEERFEIGLQDRGSKFSVRARYKFGTNLYLPGKFLVSGIYIPLYLELFFNLNGAAQFNDLMRLTPGIGYQPNQRWKFQFDLSYHRTRSTSEDKFKTNDIVFRFRVYQAINGS